jgi:chemotaxis protein CheC
MQMDAIKEIGNIGAGHAASALSQIIDKTIMITVSKLEILPLQEVYKTIGQTDEEIIAIHLKLLGNVLGGIVVVFNMENAVKLANIIERKNSGCARALDEMDQSSLKEAGAILSASYLSAIGRFTKLSLIPSTPKMEIGRLKEKLSLVFSEITKRAEVAFCIETAFIESSINLKGYFLLVPEVESLEIMLKNLGVST